MKEKDMTTATITKTTITTHPRKKCNKCQGNGFMEWFKWNAHGRCFACGGKGHVPDRSRTIVATEVVVAGDATIEVSVSTPKKEKVDRELIGLSWSEQAFIRACRKGV
jgi:DnaJ-class molecular chaperone